MYDSVNAYRAQYIKDRLEEYEYLLGNNDSLPTVPDHETILKWLEDFDYTDNV